MPVCACQSECVCVWGGGGGGGRCGGGRCVSGWVCVSFRISQWCFVVVLLGGTVLCVYSRISYLG